MTRSSFESDGSRVRFQHEGRADYEIASAWFGMCYIQHHRTEVNGEWTNIATPSGWIFDGITTHAINGGAVLTFRNDKGSRVFLTLTEVAPETLCDAVEAARLQEVTE
jgi:hypothetical protein